MAGARVVVCLPSEARGDLRAALAEALAPFESVTGGGWRDVWDWWAVRGGSDGNGFRPLPGFEGDPRLIHDDPRYDGELLPSLPGMCAGGPRGLLDPAEFRAMSERLAMLEAWAGDAWDAWQQLAPAHPPVLPLSAFRVPADGGRPARPLPQIWEEFTAQPVWRAFAAHPLSRMPELETRLRHWRPDQGDLVQALCGGREDFRRRMIDGFLQPDVLTLDGWWIYDGRRPVHGTCDAAEACAHMAVGWRHQRDIGAYVESLAGDVLLVKVKCHV